MPGSHADVAEGDHARAGQGALVDGVPERHRRLEGTEVAHRGDAHGKRVQALARAVQHLLGPGRHKRPRLLVDGRAAGVRHHVHMGVDQARDEAEAGQSAARGRRHRLDGVAVPANA